MVAGRWKMERFVRSVLNTSAFYLPSTIYWSPTSIFHLSPLAVLEPFARARLAVFLALFHARIARQQPFGLQRRPQVGVHRQQCPRDTVPHGAGLTGRATA